MNAGSLSKGVYRRGLRGKSTITGKDYAVPDSVCGSGDTMLLGVLGESG
jgi:hypothetical protein